MRLWRLLFFDRDATRPTSASPFFIWEKQIIRCSAASFLHPWAGTFAVSHSNYTQASEANLSLNFRSLQMCGYQAFSELHNVSQVSSWENGIPMATFTLYLPLKHQQTQLSENFPCWQTAQGVLTPNFPYYHLDWRTPSCIGQQCFSRSHIRQWENNTAQIHLRYSEDFPPKN